MKISVELTDSVKDIEKAMVRALHKELSSLLVRVAGAVEAPIKALVKRRIMEQPEVKSLINGRLRGEFGVPDGEARMEAIIDHWANGLHTTFQKKNQFSSRVTYSFSIHMIPSDYNDAIALADANVKISDGSLPWLEWLLKFGDKIIVRDYDVRFIIGGHPSSRTGSAVMIKGPNRQWGVPPEFSGTEDNNFVTRALDGVDEEVLDILETAMQRET